MVSSVRNHHCGVPNAKLIFTRRGFVRMRARELTNDI